MKRAINIVVVALAVVAAVAWAVLLYVKFGTQPFRDPAIPEGADPGLAAIYRKIASSQPVKQGQRTITAETVYFESPTVLVLGSRSQARGVGFLVDSLDPNQAVAGRQLSARNLRIEFLPDALKLTFDHPLVISPDGSTATESSMEMTIPLPLRPAD